MRKTDTQVILEYIEDLNRKYRESKEGKSKPKTYPNKVKHIQKTMPINHDYDDLLEDKLFGCLGG